MHMRRSAWIVCIAVLVSQGDASHLYAAHFVRLGFLDGADGVFQSNSFGVNQDGTVVVGSSLVEDGKLHAFRWTPTAGMQLLDPFLLNLEGSGATGVSADGETVVGAAVHPVSGRLAPYRWTTSRGLGFLETFVPAENGIEARAVSADGRVVVGTSPSLNGPFEAFCWTEGSGMKGLGSLPGDNFVSTALAVSADGGVVVGQSNSTNGPEAFRWTMAEGMVGLGDLAGGSFNSVAIDVSANGAVVVGAGSPADAVEEAFRWDSVSGMTGLGFLPTASEHLRSLAFATNGDGSVVVGQSGSLEEELAAFIWDARHGMRSLQQYLEADPSLAIDLAGWRLAAAADISADGRSIVGWGYNPHGHVEAWLVRLARPLTVPEPGPPMLVLLGAAILILPRARRENADSVHRPRRRFG